MQRLTVLLLLSLFCCGFMPRKSPKAVVPSSTPQPKVEIPDSLVPLYNYTDAIRLLLAERDTVAGRRALRSAVEHDSMYAPAWYLLGIDAEAYDPVAAESYARRAYNSDTTNKWYARQYARTMIINAHYEEAVPLFEKMLRDEPSEPDNYRMLALLYQQRNKPFSALVILDSAEVRFGRLQGLSEIKRSLLIGTNQYDKALAEAETIAEETPYDITAHIVLGELYAAAGRDSLALASFRQATEMDSTNLEVQMALGDFYNRRGDYRRYLAAVDKVFRNDAMPVGDKVRQWERITSDRNFYGQYFLQISELIRTLYTKYPDNDDVTAAYAGHLLASGESETALELYKRRIAANPSDKSNYEWVIDIESYVFHRPDSTAKYIAEALRHFPDDFGLYMREGSARSIMKRHADAEKSFRKALKFAETDSLRSVVHGYIGDTYETRAAAVVNPEGKEHFPGLFKAVDANSKARGLLKKCFAEYDKALALDPDNAAVLNNYSYFLSEQDKDIERAVEMGRRATEISRNNATYLDTYAWALHKAGRNAEAKRTMQQALSMDRSNSAELQIHYGDILAAMGERFMAEIYWRRALENGYPADAVTQRIEHKTDDGK